VCREVLPQAGTTDISNLKFSRATQGLYEKAILALSFPLYLFLRIWLHGLPRAAMQLKVKDVGFPLSMPGVDVAHDAAHPR
jgi:hypothetical protein